MEEILRFILISVTKLRLNTPSLRFFNFLKKMSHICPMPLVFPLFSFLFFFYYQTCFRLAAVTVHWYFDLCKESPQFFTKALSVYIWKRIIQLCCVVNHHIRQHEFSRGKPKWTKIKLPADKIRSTFVICEASRCGSQDVFKWLNPASVFIPLNFNKISSSWWEGTYIWKIKRNEFSVIRIYRLSKKELLLASKEKKNTFFVVGKKI